MKYLIALLTAATGVLHLVVGFGLVGGAGTNWLLVLNGVGYLVLLILFWMASGNGGIIRWILLAYTLITLIGYFVISGFSSIGFGDTFTTVATIIKAIELLLVLLLLLYRGSQPVAVATPRPTAARTGPAVDASRMSQTIGTTAASASAGASTAAAAAAVTSVSMADRVAATVDEAIDDTADVVDDATDAVGDAVDYVGDKAEDAYDATADMADDAAGTVVDTAGDAVDYVGDKAEDAYDATADMAGDAADAVGDAAGAAVDTAGDAVDYVGDKAGDAYDATVDLAEDAASGPSNVIDYGSDAGLAGAGAAALMAADRVSDTGDVMDVSAAELNAAQLAAEPSAEEVRKELEEYLRSFGSSSEFRKEIEYIEGIGAAYGQKLRGMGINTIMDLVVNGATRVGRKHISDQSGISQSLILTWVNHVDLFRIKGVAQEYADLLEQSGVDTVVELAQRNPANLHKRMLEINEQKSLVRRAPHASEVQSWVEQAKNLRRLIHY
jgi:hypothetical protein